MPVCRITSSASYGCMPRSIDSSGKAAVYASAIKGNSCYVRGQPTMIATAGGAGLVSMCVVLLLLPPRVRCERAAFF
jgi:hypothetical protein